MKENGARDVDVSQGKKICPNNRPCHLRMCFIYSKVHLDSSNQSTWQHLDASRSMVTMQSDSTGHTWIVVFLGMIWISTLINPDPFRIVWIATKELPLTE